MKLKRCIVLVFCFVCLCSICMQNVFAASISEGSAILNDEDYVELHCVSPDGEGAYVTIVVTHPAMSRPFHVAELLAGENGVVDLSLKMSKSDDLSGKYTVYFGGANLKSTQLVPFIFINDADDAAVCSAISNKTSGIEGIIDSIADICGIERGEGTLFAGLSEAGKTKVYDALKERTFTQGIEIKEAFDKATVLQNFKEKENPADMEAYADILEIPVGEGSDYAGLGEDFKQRVRDGFVAYDFALNNTDEVPVVFNKLVYTQMINSVSKENRNDLIKHIEDVNSLGYIDISLAEYNSSDFDDDDRLSVVKKVLEDRDKALFSDLEAVKDSFENAIEEVEDEKDEAKKKASSSRGGGGSGGHSSVPGVTVPTGSNAGAAAGSTGTGADEESTTPAVSKMFSDTSTVPWAVEAIDYLCGTGVINGVGDGRFEPDRYITRAEFVHMIIKAFNIPAKETEHVFEDVSTDDWFHDSVMTAYASAIVNGIDESHFGADTPITREQLCTVAYRAQNVINFKIETDQFEVVFNDKDMVSDYAIQAVESMYRAGIVNGVGNNEFAPKAFATRAMAAKIVYGLLRGGN